MATKICIGYHGVSQDIIDAQSEPGTAFLEKCFMVWCGRISDKTGKHMDLVMLKYLQNTVTRKVKKHCAKVT